MIKIVHFDHSDIGSRELGGACSRASARALERSLRSLRARRRCRSILISCARVSPSFLGAPSSLRSLPLASLAPLGRYVARFARSWEHLRPRVPGLPRPTFVAPRFACRWSASAGTSLAPETDCACLPVLRRSR